MNRVPNLDACEPADLWMFYHQYHRCGYRVAGVLFPERLLKYVIAARDLAHYACNKAAAVVERKKGNIQTAEMYEGICDHIYKQLPIYAKW